MKLVVTGATGFVGTEVLRQALRDPRVTRVVALARRPVATPAGTGPASNAAKLTSVVLADADAWTAPYPRALCAELADTDACIWCLAFTPTDSLKMPSDDVTRICKDFTEHGLACMAAETKRERFRFVYMSGLIVERDQSKPVPYIPEYFHMRGRLETALLAFAQAHAPETQVAIVKPGAIDGPRERPIITEKMQSLHDNYIGEAHVHISELAVGMVRMALEGAPGGKDTLWGGEMAAMGKELLTDNDYLWIAS